MEKAQAFYHLFHVAFDLIWSEAYFWIVEQAVQIMLAVLKDEEDGAFLAVVIRRFGRDNLLQVDDARVVEPREQLHLAYRGDRELRDGRRQEAQSHQTRQSSDTRLFSSGRADDRGAAAGWRRRGKRRTPSFSLHMLTFLSATTSLVSLFVALYTVLCAPAAPVQIWMAAEALQACRPKLLELRRRALLSPVGTLTNDTILFVVVERLHGHSTWAWLQPGAVPKCSSGGSGGGSDGAAALVVLRAHTSLSDRQPQCAAASMLLDVRAVARPPAHTAVAARAVTQVAQHLLARAVNKGCPAPAGTNFVPDGRWAVRGARPDGG